MSFLASRTLCQTLITGGIVFVGYPLIFYVFPIIRWFIVLPPAVREDIAYQQPEKYGFKGAKSFFLDTEDGSKLGVWHTLPADMTEYPEQAEFRGETVFLYLHGNSETRDQSRLTYQVLNKLKYHVVTFDYRGFAESTGKTKSESTLFTDASTVFKWVQKKFPNGKIYFWGFSMGSGVACGLGFKLAERNVKINGIILESPFSNMSDAVRASKVSQALFKLPLYEKCVMASLKSFDLMFPNDHYLSKIKTPVLILHAEDDLVIPSYLSDKLYATVLSARKGNEGSIKLIKYDASLCLGHGGIAINRLQLSQTVKQFVEENV